MNHDRGKCGALFRLAVLRSAEPPSIPPSVRRALSALRTDVDAAAQAPRPRPTALVERLAVTFKEVRRLATSWAEDVDERYLWMSRFVTLDAVDALRHGDGPLALNFLHRVLKLRPDAARDGDRLLVLQDTLASRPRRARRSHKWYDVEPNLLAYLTVLLENEVRRTQRDAGASDRLRRRVEHLDGSLDELDAPAETWDRLHLASPPELYERERNLRVRRGVLDDVRPGLGPDQAELLRLLEAGLSPAEAVEQLGGRWSPYQALQRKAKRRLRQVEP